jgi:(p)ppGpp synthase/HD superfamily hydrolase
MSSESLVELAERIATEAHAGQFRRCGIVPYIEHPRAVVSRVGDDPEAQASAWLHDVVEDSEYTAEALLEAGIPTSVVDAVAILTKTPGLSYDDYLERVAASPLATKVKVADMLSNLADNPSDKQIRKYAKGLLRLVKG